LKVNSSEYNNAEYIT